MSNVLDRRTLQYLISVHTPNYSVQDYVINPDMSAVIKTPSKYWKLRGDIVSVMSQAEKDVVDANTLPPSKSDEELVLARLTALEDRTAALEKV